MDESSQIKEILYSYLKKIPEEKVQATISKGKSADLIDEILQNCLPKVLKLQNDVDKNVGVLAESLMHYLLTTSLTPSQRKIEKNDLEIGIIIPDLKTLETQPKDSLVICFPKTSNENSINQKLTQLKKYQPNRENLWFVLNKDLELGCKTFVVKEKNGTFSKILDEIINFLWSSKKTQFRIFKV